MEWTRISLTGVGTGVALHGPYSSQGKPRGPGSGFTDSYLSKGLDSVRSLRGSYLFFENKKPPLFTFSFELVSYRMRT